MEQLQEPEKDLRQRNQEAANGSRSWNRVNRKSRFKELGPSTASTIKFKSLAQKIKQGVS